MADGESNSSWETMAADVTRAVDGGSRPRSRVWRREQRSAALELSILEALRRKTMPKKEKRWQCSYQCFLHSAERSDKGQFFLLLRDMESDGLLEQNSTLQSPAQKAHTVRQSSECLRHTFV
ncbi:unnamed protein product [Heligmosomoides polygyrus]|uniref:Uncharacterized protein n=1 Tax=Heligmosomoides polygyrus TaxID=6339 RepID=A0A183FYF2_HELPZ|nr:unnamed protein product [Heligmosomoides polygyrus]